MFMDTHCHIYHEYYEDIDAVIKDSKELGVSRFLNNAVDVASMNEVLRLVKEYDGMYAAIGFHPEEVDHIPLSDIELLEAHLKDKNVIAIGEIGLDYHYTKENSKAQEVLFRKQLELAEKYQLPVIIHSRDATEDTIRILKDYHVTGVIHSFSGSYETAMIYLKMGFSFGINGVITFKNSRIKEVIKRLPLESILLETDSPYLTPDPYRGKKNEPKYVSEIAKFVADFFEISLEDLSRITTENIKRIFDK